jgi:branched-chain amino acid transport system substrate-binding protein
MNSVTKLGATLAALMLCAATAQGAEAVKIGFMTTLSGPGGGVGTEMRDGFQLAVKHAAGKLGGLPTEVLVVDDQQKPDVGAQIVDKFINRDKVTLITGTIFSNVLLPVLPTILDSKTIMISPNTGPEQLAGAGCNPYFFATAFQNEDHAGAMALFMNGKNLTDVAMIAPNYPGGRETLMGFKRKFKGKIVEEIYTKMGQPDYSAEIAQIRASGAKSVFFFLPGGMGINFIRQYVAAGANRTIPLYTPGFSADEDTIKSVGEPMVGLYNSSQWTLELPNAANKKFVADFQAEYGRRPTLFSAMGYDTGRLIDAAIKQVGGKTEDSAAFRAALAAAKFDTVRGTFRFNKNHYPVQNYYLRQVVKNDKGEILNKQESLIVENLTDPFVGQCNMPG